MFKSFSTPKLFFKSVRLCRVKHTRSIMEIKVYPEDPLIDEKLEIIITGLIPNQEVSIKATVTEAKSSFSSTGWFISDSDGNVHVDKQSSLGGTYKGTDSMGLFWSMIPDPGQQKGRYYKHSVSSPQSVILSVYNGHISSDDYPNTSSAVIISKDLQRRFLHETVNREEIREGNLRGTLFTPPGPGPFPGVIDMFGTAGGNVEYRAAMLASRGFITYTLPYFNYEDLPKNFTEISYEYLKESVEWLSQHPKVIEDGIGVMGMSKGGELALMLSTQCKEIKSVVNINGAPFPSYAPIGPFTDFVEADTSKYRFEEDGVCIYEALNVDLKTEHIFKTWESNAQIMYIAGDDDQAVDPKYSQMLYDLYPKNQQHKLIVKRYPKTGHLIEPCYTPFCRASYHKVFGINFVWGGEMKAHAKAQEDSWHSIKEFLKSTLVPDRYKQFRTMCISSQL